MIKKGIKVHNSNVLVLGITFKEDCPDIRNSRAIDIIRELTSFSVKVDVFDPWASDKEVKDEYGIDLICKKEDITKVYDGVILAVSHKQFMKIDLNDFVNGKNVKFDVKSVLPKELTDSRL
jgi:UDP-N-acetyl-D-galactosamine dehydrogenase